MQERSLLQHIATQMSSCLHRACITLMSGNPVCVEGMNDHPSPPGWPHQASWSACPGEARSCPAHASAPEPGGPSGRPPARRPLPPAESSCAPWRQSGMPPACPRQRCSHPAPPERTQSTRRSAPAGHPLHPSPAEGRRLHLQNATLLQSRDARCVPVLRSSAQDPVLPGRCVKQI